MARSGPDRYDDIGTTYATTRREEPSFAAAIDRALADAERVCNVGAGTGSYEPRQRSVVAVEPSVAMLGQRAEDAAPAVRGVAEALPFPDASFDAALAVLTVHHWRDRRAGLAELRRVATRQAVVFFEPLIVAGVWLLDYWPEARRLPTEMDAPGLDLLSGVLDVVDVAPLLVPRDCADGFAAAFWARPEAYLSAEVLAGISLFALLPAEVRDAGRARLAADLASGAWDASYGPLREQDTFDGGYRLAVAVNAQG